MDRSARIEIAKQLTITPIVGWRTWAISRRRPWENGSGMVLRGAWGRAWPDVTSTARCLRPPTHPDATMGGFLDGLENASHPGPAPEPACTCGIYALKTEAVGAVRNPRLAGRPTISGFVELSGVVIEGEFGYRAQQAAIVGPLELAVPCAGVEAEGSASCTEPATAVFTQDDLKGVCAEHTRLPVEADPTELSEWVDQVVPQLEATYQAPIIYLEKGANHGHR